MSFYTEWEERIDSYKTNTVASPTRLVCGREVIRAIAKEFIKLCLDNKRDVPRYDGVNVSMRGATLCGLKILYRENLWPGEWRLR